MGKKSSNIFMANGHGTGPKQFQGWWKSIAAELMQKRSPVVHDEQDTSNDEAQSGGKSASAVC
jgi:hypothetical protein